MSFQNKLFVKKSSYLLDPINKINVQQFSPDEKEKVLQQSSDICVKHLAGLQRNVDVARGRGLSRAQIMEHDLL